MKVLTINNLFPPDYVGGAEISSFYSVYGLMKRGYDCSVLAAFGRHDRDSDERYVYRGIPVHKVTLDHRANSEIGKIFDPAFYRIVRRELDKTRPDLVHIHNVSGTSLAPFLACRSAGVPVVCTLHDYWMLCPNNMLLRSEQELCDPAASPEWCRKCYDRYDFWGSVPYRRRIIKGLVDHVARFTSPSQRLIDLHAEAGYDTSRFRVMKTGIDLSLFQAPVSASTRHIIQEFAPYNTVLFAGHIVRIKGLEVLAQALPIMQRYIPNFRVLVAGAGEPQLIEQLIQAAPGAVRHVGKLPFYELRPVYASSKLAIVPSIWFDNSPTVIYESMLMGTPALGSRIGGIPELIEDEVTGYLFRAGDPGELAEKAIAHFARPAKERRDMRRRCAEWAAKNLTLDTHIDRLTGIYDEAMEAANGLAN